MPLPLGDPNPPVAGRGMQLEHPQGEKKPVARFPVGKTV